MMSFRVRFVQHHELVKILLLLSCLACVLEAQERVEVEFGFQENDWSDPETLEFKTEHLLADFNTWGNEDQTDFYVETGSSADRIDAVIPGSQGVRENDIIVAQFESRYLDDSNNHSYLVFGSEFELENAVFFGHGGGRFHIGTGTEFDLSSADPSGVNVAASFANNQFAEGAGNIANDSRVSIRMGFDVAQSRIRNFQIDSNNDGEFDAEFLESPIDAPDVDALDWFLISYAGRGNSRADNVAVFQRNSLGDFNEDLDFNELDVDILCRDGVAAGNVDFDYNGDGQINIEDVNDFSFDHGSLPADIDFNGTVEFADFLVYSENFSQPATYSQGDITCNGLADFPDFLILSTFFGSTARAQAFNAVPEPADWQLFPVIVCCLGALRRRR